MIHRLSIRLAYATFVHHDDVHLLRLFMVRILPRAAHQTKTAALKGAHVCQALFQMAAPYRRNQQAKVGFDLEQTFFERSP
jgi:hypothetical protein